MAGGAVSTRKARVNANETPTKEELLALMDSIKEGWNRMVHAQRLKEGLKYCCDYVRCRRCDAEQKAKGEQTDICVPYNSNADLCCPCGQEREPFDCQSGEFLGAT